MADQDRGAAPASIAVLPSALKTPQGIIVDLQQMGDDIKHLVVYFETGDDQGFAIWSKMPVDTAYFAGGVIQRAAMDKAKELRNV